MVGSKAPLRVDAAALERRIHDPASAPIYRALGVSSARDLAGLYTAGPAELRRFVGDGPLLLDDRPSVEYFLSLPMDPMIDVSGLHGDPFDVITSLR